MITLYNKLGTTKLGELNNCIECLIEEERNGIFDLYLVYPIDDPLFNSLQEENIIISNANDTLLNQKFRIYMTRKLMTNEVEVYARHISFDLGYDFVENISLDNASCEYALNTIFRNSQFSQNYRGYSDVINAQNYTVSNTNCLDAIGGKSGSIIDTFGTGVEILRDNENIHVLNKRGHDNEVTIEYAKNLTGFELEEDLSELVTRIKPYAKYNDSETNEEVIVEADYVDSPLIFNYSHPYIAYIDYSDKFKDDEIPTTTKLIELARKDFTLNKVDIPKQNFKIEFIPLSKCVGYEGLEDKISLCDTVTIKDTRYGINTKAKVIKTVFNVLKNRYESMELGEPKTSLGDIIGNGGGSEGGVGPQGPQGPQGPAGPPGADGNIGDFPDSLPTTPILTSKLYGFSSIELSWTFESKVYYQYELYASKTKNFTPNVFDLIHQGQTSSFLFQAKPNETWYFKVCAVNSHGNRTGFSNQATVTTKKIDDMSNYFEEAAISNAVIGTLTSDYMEAGIIKGHYIDGKNLSVTDGNGQRTLDIDSFGNVHIKATSFSLSGKDIATQDELNKSVVSVDVMYYLSTSQTSLLGGSWTTVAPTWVNGKYMWSKTVTTFVNGNKRESSPTCIAGAKGDTGLNGTDGKGVKSITNYYLASSNSSGVTISTSGWTTTIQNPTLSKKYLWNYEKITYTDDSYFDTLPCIIGNYASDGIDGLNGIDGTDGKGISSIVEYYLVSPNSTGIANTSSGWSTTIPTMTTTNKYLWNYEKITYTDNTYTNGKPRVIGAYGDKGQNGTDGVDGVGIKEIIEQYYLSTSKTTQTGGSWVTTPPSWVKGKYIWTRSKITYTDNKVVYTTPICDSSWDAINQQTSQEIFNILTENGSKQGIFMKNNQLYVNGEYVNGGVIKGSLLQTYADDSTKGVRIARESMQLNNTAFFYKTDGNFNIQSKEGINVSSMKNIYLMPGLNEDGTVSGNYEVVIPTCTTRLQKLNVVNGSTLGGDLNVSGATTLSKLTVNGNTMFNNGNIYVNRLTSTDGAALWFSYASGAIYAGRNLNMNGYSITNQSDRKLKENIKYVDDVVLLDAEKKSTLKDAFYDDFKNKFKFATYNYKKEEQKDKTHFGFIAQDLEETSFADYVLVEGKDKNDEDVLCYDVLGLVNTYASVLQKEIEIRDNQIEDLTSRIAKLEKTILNSQG